MAIDQRARVYSYDISEALSHVSENLPHVVMLGYMGYESLIDGLLDWAFHGFEFISIKNYATDNYHPQVRAWFQEQDLVVSKLWHQFSVEWQYAGREAFIVRRGKVLWLFVLV